MKITVVAAGKIKEAFYRDAVSEYAKRLSHYCDLEIKEVPDGPDREAEGMRILKLLPENAWIAALMIDGRDYDSPGFAKLISDLTLKGDSHLVFVIGASEGLSEAVVRRAGHAISFSRMTFPHMLMRVILLEQIYRAMRINHNEPYHK